MFRHDSWGGNCDVFAYTTSAALNRPNCRATLLFKRATYTSLIVTFEMADVVSNLKYIYTSHVHEDYTMSSAYGLRSICSAIRILTKRFSAHAVRIICWPRHEPGVTSPGGTSAINGG